MTKVLVLTRDIAAPPETVWRIISDIDGSPARLRGIHRVERLPDSAPGYAVGTAWRETRRMFGQSASEEMRVTAVDPGRSTTIEAVAAGTHYVSEFHLAPGPRGGTTLTFEFSGRSDGPGSLAKSMLLDIVGAFGLAATRKAMRSDLDDIASAAEAEHRASRGPGA